MSNYYNALEDSTLKHSFYQVNPSVCLHYVEAGQENGVPLVLLHGWPDLWFGWRVSS
jgi:soluble epoxide hydrolase/lipid-phosphate phosphatase